DAGDEEADPDAVPPLVEVEATVAAFEEMRVLGPVEGEEAEGPAAEPSPEGEDEPDVGSDAEDDRDGAAAAETLEEPHEPVEGSDEVAETDEAPPAAAEQVAREEEALVLPLFDRLRSGEDEDAGSEPAFAAAVDPIEAPPEEEEADPVAVLADDLARRLRRALADEQNQVLDRLRQDRRGQLGLDELLGPDDARVVRLATAIEPRLREAVGEQGDATGAVGDLAARLAGAVADGVRHDIEQRVSAVAADDGERVDLSRPVREAFRAWRTDRILPLAAEVAAESLGG
ncbi:MAG: hypothetical protein ABW143_02235, partial [Acidimicrobiales bacterium]